MKKLIPALCMLLVSAILLGTSTYAWFSMSKDVTATGMEITAKSDAIFLEINGTEDGGVYSTTGTNAVNAQLYAAHHVDTWSALADVTDFDLDDDSTADNWYYRYNANSDNATNAMTPITYIDSFTDYVAVSQYNVRLRQGSQATGYDLYVKSITIPANKGITVIIAGQDGYKEFSATATPAFSTADVISNTVTTTAQVVTAYIYFNGDDANVYTDNINTLTGEISFVLSAFETDN